MASQNLISNFNWILILKGYRKAKEERRASPEDCKYTSCRHSDDLAELWAVKYWKQFVEEKNKLLDTITKGKIIEDKAAYLVGIFKKKGYV